MIVLMILLGFYFIPMSSVVHAGSSDHAVRKTRLVAKDKGIEFLYFQQDVATPEEVAKGRLALSQWPTADKVKRNSLADDLVIGNTLVRKTKEALVKRLGPSEDNHPDRGSSPPDGLFYDVTSDEKWCFLNIRFVDNKSDSVWLTVKY